MSNENGNFTWRIVPVDVWNDMARKVESADALRGAIDGLPNITETDARSIELIAKYAINHSMYGGGIILSMMGAVREAKRKLHDGLWNLKIGGGK